MAEIRLDKSVSIRATPEAIYAELAEPRSQLGLQPLLAAVAEIDTGDPSGARVFDAVEVFHLLGPLRLRNRIRVRIDRVRPGEVVEFEARSFPSITVRSRFTLVAHPDATELRERIRVEVPRLLRGFVAAQVDRAQAELLTNLKRRLESGGAAA
jgi:hypothetical protein